MKPHPLADLVPKMRDADYAELKASIKQCGLMEPITIFEGKILDGRNRFRACQELGITPLTVEYTGGDPAEFVLGKNVYRRHLDESQRGMVAGRLATMKQGARTDIAPIGAMSETDAAEKLNVGRRTVQRARQVLDNGVPELQKAVEAGTMKLSEAADIAQLDQREQYSILNEPSKQERRKTTKARVAEKKKAKVGVPESAPLVLMSKSGRKAKDYYLVDEWKALSAKERASIIEAGFSAKGAMNKQETANIEWAKHSLNTVTGCLHECPYCYARDIAERLFRVGFQPAFWPSRLSAASVVSVPKEADSDLSFRNIFANSMSDLFGNWVPEDWITATIEMATRNPQWNFLTLTKFPQRAANFEFPVNWWMGTTVDAQARVENAEKAFAKIRCGTKWLSCEPLLEPLKFSRLDLFQWVVIGGSSQGKNTPEWVPPIDWIADLHAQARGAGCRIYYKTNCGMRDELRLREFPWGTPEPKSLPRQFRYLKGMDKRRTA